MFFLRSSPHQSGWKFHHDNTIDLQQLIGSSHTGLYQGRCTQLRLWWVEPDILCLEIPSSRSPGPALHGGIGSSLTEASRWSCQMVSKIFGPGARGAPFVKLKWESWREKYDVYVAFACFRMRISWTLWNWEGLGFQATDVLEELETTVYTWLTLTGCMWISVATAFSTMAYMNVHESYIKDS